MKCVMSLLSLACLMVIGQVCGQNEFTIDWEKVKQACRDAYATLGSEGLWQVKPDMLVTTRTGGARPQQLFLGADLGTADLAKAPRDRPLPRMGGHKRTTTLPKAYSVREKFGANCPSMNQILKQGCGNCWAYATTSMINDRHCMNKPATAPLQYVSTKSLTQCFPNSCNGGNCGNALDYWVKNGIPTGGETRIPQDPLGCQPFDYNFRLESDQYTCPKTCKDGTQASADQISKGRVAYYIENNTTKIMEEIFNYGPVVASFDVYTDLGYCYKSGIYRHIAGEKMGGHAVKVYGWGEENGVEYWLAHNSWDNTWGEGGFFKMIRGYNEGGFENGIVAAIPELGQAATSHDCEDDTRQASYCAQFASNLILCDDPRYESDTKISCKKTCQWCTPRGKLCLDDTNNADYCASVVQANACATQAPAQTYCRKSCNFC